MQRKKCTCLLARASRDFHVITSRLFTSRFRRRPGALGPRAAQAQKSRRSSACEATASWMSSSNLKEERQEPNLQKKGHSLDSQPWPVDGHAPKLHVAQQRCEPHKKIKLQKKRQNNGKESKMRQQTAASASRRSPASMLLWPSLSEKGPPTRKNKKQLSNLQAEDTNSAPAAPFLFNASWSG